MFSKGYGYITLDEWLNPSDDFDLVIDARSEREFEEDHIPGAINLPVVHNEEYAKVGTLHKTDTHKAYLLGVKLSMVNIAQAIEINISDLPRGAKILVYCFRGGKRSKLWLDALLTIGFKAKRLEGGWKGYRGWVRDSLGILPDKFKFKVLCGPTGCGKTRLLAALRVAGEQVLDLEDIANHRGSLIGYVPGLKQPSQKYFDTLLLKEMQSFDPDRPIWVEAESKKIGDVSLPDSLFSAIHKGLVYRVEAPMNARVALWREDYGHFEKDPSTLLSKLKHLRPIVGGDEFELWQEYSVGLQMPKLFERLMTHHYDIAYERSIRRNYPSYEASPLIALDNLTVVALADVAKNLINE